MFVKWFGFNWGHNCLLALGLSYLVLSVFPGSYWFDVGETEIPEVEQGKPVEILFTGGPVRNFIGSYTVTMREFGSRQIMCEAHGGPFPYDPSSERPDPLTMEWWAVSDPRCYRPAVGSYIVVACWDIEGPFFGLVPPKQVCTDPAHFRITPSKQE